MADPRIRIVAEDRQSGTAHSARLIAEVVESAGVCAETVLVTPAVSRLDVLRRRVARTQRGRPAALTIHVERIFPLWARSSGGNWLVPNPEWFSPDDRALLPLIDLVVTKTQSARAAFAGLGVPTVFTSFTSRDRLLPEPARHPEGPVAIHIAGRSASKGAQSVLSAWSRHPEWPRLTIVYRGAWDPAPAETLPKNINVRSTYVPDDELRRLQNQAWLHLCPSSSEGWGHTIVEGLSTGAVVVALDGEPMNEIVREDRGVLVPVVASAPFRLGRSHHSAVDDLETAISWALSLDPSERSALGQRARDWFVANDARFRGDLAALVRDRVADPQRLPARGDADGTGAR